MSRDVLVRLSLRAEGFVSGAQQAIGAAKSLKGELSGLQDATLAHPEAFKRVGTAATVMGAAMLAGVGMAAKAAMDWQSAFAGVEKTVDGTSEQIRGLEGDLRGMARSMAATHEEIAATAEAAGQLGVATENVADFTRVMVMLGETTNLTADEAATSMAQFMNIMGSSADQVGQFGAVLVDLGNKGASTERQIMELGQRLAGAGNQIGLSEAQVLGFGNAIASLGVSVEAGGTAMSKIFLKLRGHVEDGKASLDVLNEVTGTDFARAFNADAAGAIDMFVQGLGRMQGEGKNVASVLADLGMKGQYERDVLMRLAGATEAAGGAQNLLAESLRNADQAMRNSANGGGALMDEYAKRAATAESKVTVAWNNIKDAAISAGQAAIPAVSAFADEISLFAQIVGQIPAPVQGVALGMAAVGGAALVSVGGVIKAASTLAELKEAAGTVSTQFPKLAQAAKTAGTFLSNLPWDKITSGAARAGLALGVAALAIQAYAEHANSSLATTDQVAAGLETLGRSSTGLSALQVQVDGLDKAMRAWGSNDSINGVGDMFRKIGDYARSGTLGLEEFVDGFMGVRSGAGLLRDELNKIDASLASMATGGSLSAAQVAFTKISDESLAAGESLEFTAAQMPAYQAALQNTAAALDVTTLSATDYANWMRGDVPEAIQNAMAGGGQLVDNLSAQQAAMATATTAAEQQTAALREMTEAQGKAAQGAASLSSSQNAMEDSLDKAAEAIKKNTKEWDRDTEAGRANWAVIDSIATSTGKYVEQLAKTGAPQAELNAAITRGRDAMVEYFKAMGMTAEAAEELADRYNMIPDQVTTLFNTPGAAVSKQQAKDMEGAVKKIPSLAETSILAPGARPSKAEVDAFVESVGDVPGLTTAQIRTIANLYGVEAAQRAIASVQGKTVYVNVNYRATGSTRGPSWVASHQADGGILDKTQGALVQAYANGGMWDGSFRTAQPQIRPAGGLGVLWAEDGAGPWEGYVSGHPAKRHRSRSIMEELARRLGGQVMWATPYADGGIHQTAAPIHYAPSMPTSTHVTVSGGVQSADVARMIAAAMPREIVAVDADGALIGRMRVEARGAVHESISTGRGRR